MTINIQKRPQGVLFDLDGTLLDTAPDLGAALNHVLQSLGFAPKSHEEYRVVSSNGALGMLKMGLGERIEDFDIETLRKQFIKHYEDNISEGTEFFPGIKAFLQLLIDHTIPWGIVTNKPGFLTEKLLKAFPEFKDCKVCYSGDTFANRKPHPEPLTKAAQVLGIAPENIWYVGDAPRDMEAATAANMIRVLARFGYLTQEELDREWDVDIAVETALDLSEKFKNL